MCTANNGSLIHTSQDFWRSQVDMPVSVLNKLDTSTNMIYGI